jgi:8-oxo-dGTP pyrophosphatase MutT (NUDIX family)
MRIPKIRPIVLCLFRRDDRILVFRGYDSVKQEYFYRPLGGGIEFGETGRDAIIREIREELGAEIENVIYLGALENLFTLEGEPGHEIVLVYDATFVDGSIYERDSIIGHELEIDSSFLAEWKSVDELRRDSALLAPVGLAELTAESEIKRRPMT